MPGPFGPGILLRGLNKSPNVRSMTETIHTYFTALSEAYRNGGTEHTGRTVWDRLTRRTVGTADELVKSIRCPQHAEGGSMADAELVPKAVLRFAPQLAPNCPT